jgi:hypothetical protein
MYRDTEPVPHGISSEHNGQGEDDSVLEMRDALRIGKYNPSVAEKIYVEKNIERRGQRPNFIIYNIKQSNGTLIKGNKPHHADLLCV